MSTAEQKIIRDYLGRKYWYYIAGAIIHFACVYATGWTDHISLIGVLGGSAFILMFELMRGGNATARTLLSLPVTAGQLARAWRFVALTLPVVLYLLILLIGSFISLKMGGKLVNLERIIILAITQTGMIGTAFFALTGMPVQPAAGGGFAKGLSNAFFGLLWGFSVPALMFAVSMAPDNFAGITAGHVLAGLFLTAATVGAWFRAEALVERRAERPGGAIVAPHGHSARRERAMPWKGIGAMPFYFVRFGLVNALVFTFMVCICWFGMNLFFGLSSGGSGNSDNIRDTQLGMFIPMIGLIAFMQMLPSLRVLRTMPRRLTTLTSCLVFWPLLLTTSLALAAYLVQPSVYGGTVDWSGYSSSLAASSIILFGIPLVLRFGLRATTMIPILVLLSVSQGLNLFVRDVFKIDLLTAWPLLAAGIVAIIAVVWYSTFLSLRSVHPWRGSLLKLPGMQRKM